MPNAHDFGQELQSQTLDAVRKTQDAIVETVTAWTETAGTVPGFTELTKQIPASADVIDSSFDFAEQILNSQRDFASRIVAAATPKSAPAAAVKSAPKSAPKAVAAAPAKTAPKATPAKKSAPRKTSTAAKVTSSHAAK